MDPGIEELFSKYEESKRSFVQSIADLVGDKEKVEKVRLRGVLKHLRILMADTSEDIQQAAALAIARMAAECEDVAKDVVSEGILDVVINSLKQLPNGDGAYYRRSAANVLRAISKHSLTLAEACDTAGALPELRKCLSDPDLGVQESATFALTSIVRHSKELASHAVQLEIDSLITVNGCDTSVTLTRLSLSLLVEMAMHFPEITKTRGAIQYAHKCLYLPDVRSRRNALIILTHISQHSTECCETVVQENVIPGVYKLLQDQDTSIRKSTGSLAAAIAKHTPELSALIVNTGGVTLLLRHGVEETMLQVMRNICSHTAGLAWSCIEAGVVQVALRVVLDGSGTYYQETVRVTAVTLLHTIASYGPEHSRSVTDAGVLLSLMDVLTDDGGTDDLRSASKKSIKSIISHSRDLSSLEPLLHTSAPPSILKYLCRQYSLILPTDITARRAFVANRGLSTVQRLSAPVGSPLHEYIQKINKCFPKEVVQYFDPTAVAFDVVDDYRIQ